MENAIILLTGSLFLALFIERLLELLKSLYDVIEIQTKRHTKWNELSGKIGQQLYARISSTKADSKYEDFHIKLVFQYLFSEHPDYKGSYLVSADKIRTIFVKYLSKLVGIVLGLIFAFTTDTNLFVLIDQSTPSTQSLPSIFTTTWLTGNFGELLTGIVMGLGAGPMHKFIVALERARKNRKNTGLV